MIKQGRGGGLLTKDVAASEAGEKWFAVAFVTGEGGRPGRWIKGDGNDGRGELAVGDGGRPDRVGGVLGGGIVAEGGGEVRVGRRDVALLVERGWDRAGDMATRVRVAGGEACGG